MKKVNSVEKSVKIKDANGTTDESCKCCSLIEHWELFSEERALKCAANTCNKVECHNAHIAKPLSENEVYETNPFIVPMSSSLNEQHVDEFYSKVNTSYVWADGPEISGK